MALNPERYNMFDAKDEFQEEIDGIIETIKLSMKTELKYNFSFNFEWNETSKSMNAGASMINLNDDLFKIRVNIVNPMILVNLLEVELDIEDETQKKEMIHSMVSHILSFTMWHEYYHIAFGHCTIPKYKNEFNEIISNGEGSFQRQQLEIMCDMAAFRKFAIDVFILFAEKKDEEVFEWLFFIMFVCFHQMEQTAFENSILPTDYDELVKYVVSEERTHPFAAFRFECFCLVMEMEINRLNFEVDIENIMMNARYKLDKLGFVKDLKVNINSDLLQDYYLRLIDIDMDDLLKDTQKIYILT